ncbi:MAG: GGDEF domain-containing protein [Sedimentibacter sp.]
MNVSSINTDLIGIVSLFFTINLAKRNAVIDIHKTKIYIFAAFVVIAILSLEILDTLFQISSNIEYIGLYKIVNIFGFLLAPVVPFVLLFLNNNKIYSKIIVYSIPLCINVFINILSYTTGGIFYIDAQGQYFRGKLFFLSIGICAFYYILLIISIIQNDSEYDKEDLLFLKFAFLVPFMAVILQILFYGFCLVWASVALTLLLYYIFLRELQFKFDATSRIKNRKTFEKEMEQCERSKENVAIVVLDLNDLKKINDTKGHNAGDEAILISATVLHDCFKGFGSAYRIGGDEFCVICISATKKMVDNALLKLEHLLNKENKNRDIKIVLAHGYAFCKKDQNESVYDVFFKADKFMYEHKAKLKGYCGRRAED